MFKRLYLILFTLLVSVCANAYITPFYLNANELQGVAVSASMPMSGQVLGFNGSFWTPVNAASGGGGGGSGTVTSVGLALPTLFSISGSPITASGTLTGSFVSQAANLFLASPNGASGVPSMRAIVAADVPPLPYIASGIVPVTSGGTGTGTVFMQGSVIFAGPSGVHSQDNANFFWDDTNFRLGLGVSVPLQVLDVQASTATTTQVEQLTGYGLSNIGYRARHARGTIAAPTATQSGDLLSFYSGRGYGTTGFSSTSTGVINFTAAENFSDASMGTYQSFMTTAIGTTTAVERMRINTTGNVLIGSTTDNGVNQFQVTGSILSASTVAGANLTAAGHASLDLQIANNLSDLNSAATARTNLGLGTAAILNVTTTNTPNAIPETDINGNYISPGWVSGATKIITANYQILPTDTVILADTTAAPFSVSFPSPASHSRFKIIDKACKFGTNQLTVVPHASEAIQNVSASQLLSSNCGNYEYSAFDGANWYKSSAASNLASRTFISSGSWTVPGGVTQVILKGFGASSGSGGGGAGGGGSTASGAGGGGAGNSGGYAPMIFEGASVPPGSVITITIGAGGSGGTGGTPAAANASGSTGGNGGSGNTGGNTTFGTVGYFQGAQQTGGGGNGGTISAGGSGGTIVSQAVNDFNSAGGGAGGGPATAATFGGFQGFSVTAGRVSAGTGGASGGVNGGGGGGASGSIWLGDVGSVGSLPTSASGAAAGGTGNGGFTGITTTLGGSASGGTGGGGGGLLSISGTAGGAGGAGGAGSNGQLTIMWSE